MKNRLLVTARGINIESNSNIYLIYNPPVMQQKPQQHEPHLTYLYVFGI
jgi:hypothetical protein